MRYEAGSRRNITLNYTREIVRIALLLCLLGSVAAFAANLDKPSVATAQRGNRSTQPPVLQDSTILVAQLPSEDSLSLEPMEPAALASMQPLPDSTSFRLLWVAAGLGLILVLRRQRRRA